jgi:pimeloyl-ACP methyl ester carboxylesterase
MRAALRWIGIALGAIIVPALVLVGWTVLRYLPVWHYSEDISFANGDVTIAGELFKPAPKGEFPAVIVLHGSGPETTTEPSYRIEARAMLDHGFAVLLYDKRGAGSSEGKLDTATYEDFAADAVAAVRYLENRDDIDAARIGLWTNSESGWFAPQVAAESGSIAFIANRVGPPLPWVDTVIWEARNDFRAAGIAEADLDSLLAVTLWRWSYYRAAGEDPSLAAGPERDAVNAEMARVYAAVDGAERVMNEQVAAYDPDFYRTFAARSAYDPGRWLRRIDVPLLYVFGETDINVPTAQAVAYLDELRRIYPAEISVHVYPGLGHSLFTWTGLLSAGYPPGYLPLVSEWAAAQVSE